MYEREEVGLHDVEQIWFWCLFMSEEVKFSIRFSTLYHPTLTLSMGLDGLKCNILHGLFYRKPGKRHHILSQKGSALIYIYTYSKTKDYKNQKCVYMYVIVPNL